jgi:glycerol-3-phosphate dehydrogenase
VLAGEKFEGAFEYHDAQMYSPERIALENLIDADAYGAAIANYVSAHEVMTGAVFDIRARTVLVAAGPWADLFLEQASGQKPAHTLIRSKGIHVMVPEISKAALTIEAGNGHLFALPWRGHTLLATTDTPFTGDPASVAVTQSDIEDFLVTFRKYLPQAGLTPDRVEFFYAGLRPLVSDGSKDSYNVSRRSELVDHAGEKLDGVFSALGGKWTTSRHLAEKITDALVARLAVKAPPCATASIPLPGGRFDDFDQLTRGFQKTYPGIGSMRPMAHMLGARLPLALKGARMTDLVSLNQSGDTMAQVLLAVASEMAITLEDMIMRRTGIGQFGPPDASVVERIANLMAAQLGWNEEKTAREIASLEHLYRTAA